MRLTLALSVPVALASPALLSAQSGPAASSAEPFKLGTLEIDGYQRVGIVLQDRLVVELDAANRALEGDPAYPGIPMPADMLELIGGYEYGLKYRLYEIVTDLVANNRLAANQRPSFVHDVGQVRARAPILYPGRFSTRRSTSTATSTRAARRRSRRRRDGSGASSVACRICS